MIAVADTGASFAGLFQYLVHGRGRQRDRDLRIDWEVTRNLPSVDRELLPSIFEATAAKSWRVEKPVYHLTISLPPSEQLQQKTLERIVDRTLQDLGLQQHQALLVAHRDKQHQHVHVMVNRVHPETGRAWHAGRDWPRIERSLRIQERELGLREVPGRHFALEDRERSHEVALSKKERQRIERTGERPFAEVVRERAGRTLANAHSWQQLHHDLADLGFAFKKRGRGLAITDGERFARASAVQRRASLHYLEKRLGPYRRPERDLVREIRRQRDVDHLRQTAGRLFEHYGSDLTQPLLAPNTDNQRQQSGRQRNPRVFTRELDSPADRSDARLPSQRSVQKARHLARKVALPDQRRDITDKLPQQAERLISKMGWKLVAQVLPVPHYRLLRFGLQLGRGLTKTGMDRGRGHDMGLGL